MTREYRLKATIDRRQLEQECGAYYKIRVKSSYYKAIILSLVYIAYTWQRPLCRPARVVAVDDENVAMAGSRMIMRVAVRWRPFPTFVPMLMIFVVFVPVLVEERVVPVFELDGVVSRP